MAVDGRKRKGLADVISPLTEATVEAVSFAVSLTRCWCKHLLCIIHPFVYHSFIHPDRQNQHDVDSLPGVSGKESTSVCMSVDWSLQKTHRLLTWLRDDLVSVGRAACSTVIMTIIKGLVVPILLSPSLVLGQGTETYGEPQLAGSMFYTSIVPPQYVDEFLLFAFY